MTSSTPMINPSASIMSIFNTIKAYSTRITVTAAIMAEVIYVAFLFLNSYLNAPSMEYVVAMMIVRGLIM